VRSARLGRRAVPAILLGVVFLLAWEAYARASGIDAVVLPPPSRVLASLWTFRDDALRHAATTLVEALIGLGVAIVLAVAVASAMDRVGPIRDALAPYLVGSQAIPIVAIAPLLVLWFGFGLAPKVLVVVLVSFFPLAIGLLDGFAGAPAAATDLIRSYGANDNQVFRQVRWPYGLPGFFTGLRIAATYAVVGAVFGEYVGAREGLGIWMQISQNSFRTDLVFAAILVAALMSVALYAAASLLERLVIPWFRASRLAA
jgi:ABC-type nitrate/sulfonate/bicarbonate transport system permease component